MRLTWKCFWCGAMHWQESDETPAYVDCICHTCGKQGHHRVLAMEQALGPRRYSCTPYPAVPPAGLVDSAEDLRYGYGPAMLREATVSTGRIGTNEIRVGDWVLTASWQFGEVMGLYGGKAHTSVNGVLLVLPCGGLTVVFEEVYRGVK